LSSTLASFPHIPSLSHTITFALAFALDLAFASTTACNSLCSTLFATSLDWPHTLPLTFPAIVHCGPDFQLHINRRCSVLALAVTVKTSTTRRVVACYFQNVSLHPRNVTFQRLAFGVCPTRNTKADSVCKGVLERVRFRSLLVDAFCRLGYSVR